MQVNLISLSIAAKKKKLRKTLKNERERTFLKNGGFFSEIISNHFKNWFENQKNIKILAFYYPINTEVNPLPILHLLKKRTLNYCLPVVENSNSPLTFREWRDDTKLIISNFGARIPSEGNLLIPDLILIPLLAYDDYGSRLGYGGGFYDRTIFSFKKNTEKKIFTLGLAFSCQKYFGKLPTEKNDEKIDSVLTEEGFQFF
ncbi:MAG: 5-formyltetrahydrofolate cyclo-ligase [Paracoccaceae bacterium]